MGRLVDVILFKGIKFTPQPNIAQPWRGRLPQEIDSTQVYTVLFKLTIKKKIEKYSGKENIEWTKEVEHHKE